MKKERGGVDYEEMEEIGLREEGKLIVGGG